TQGVGILICLPKTAWPSDFAFKMPIDMAFAAAGYGFIYGLWPIAWVIVAAVFLYKLTVASGQFDIIRSSVISITDDQRLQVLLIGFS
ncbi:L-lactate permease, partial [Pseudomonas aeruginosa]|uniref:L-lactate permease n=1 Tax=Pseudomonas aeruginosa TaxID=287 RepID=UPI00301483AF